MAESNTIKKTSNRGRPKAPEWRNKLHRTGRVVDEFTEVLPSIKNPNDREIVLQVLEKLKG